MGSLGERFQREFTRRMSQLGTTATVTRQLATAYNATTATATPDTEEITVKGFFDKAKTGQTDGVTDLQIGQRVFCIPTLDANGDTLLFDPANGDTLTIGAQAYSIRRTEPEYANDVIVYHRLFLEQA